VEGASFAIGGESDVFVLFLSTFSFEKEKPNLRIRSKVSPSLIVFAFRFVTDLTKQPPSFSE
jgi:hypothetical protein